MPYLSFREIWTPLKLIGIRLFREVESRELYIKIGNRRRETINQKKQSSLTGLTAILVAHVRRAVSIITWLNLF